METWNCSFRDNLSKGGGVHLPGSSTVFEMDEAWIQVRHEEYRFITNSNEAIPLVGQDFNNLMLFLAILDHYGQSQVRSRLQLVGRMSQYPPDRYTCPNDKAESLSAFSTQFPFLFARRTFLFWLSEGKGDFCRCLLCRWESDNSGLIFNEHHPWSALQTVSADGQFKGIYGL